MAKLYTESLNKVVGATVMTVVVRGTSIINAISLKTTPSACVGFDCLTSRVVCKDAHKPAAWFGLVVSLVFAGHQPDLRNSRGIRAAKPVNTRGHVKRSALQTRLSGGI
ncbi:MAG: hypothetical protein AABY76_03425, partial [Planctomycetota bacterium]